MSVAPARLSLKLLNVDLSRWKVIHEAQLSPPCGSGIETKKWISHRLLLFLWSFQVSTTSRDILCRVDGQDLNKTRPER